MKITVWNECYISGGADWSLIDLITSWPDKNDTFIVYVNRSHEGLDLIRSKTGERAEVRCFTSVTELLEGLGRYGRRALFPFAILLSFLRYLPLIRRSDCDVLLFNNGGFPGGLSNYLAALSAVLKGVERRVMIVRNYPHTESRFMSTARSMCNSGAVGAVVAVSNSLKESLVRDAGLKAGALKMIYNGISTENKSGAKDSQQLSPVSGFPSLAIIGTLEERKGHGVLFRAWKEVLETFPEARLYVAGSSRSGDKDELVELSRGLGIEGSIVWLEFVRDIGEVYQRVDAVAIPSQEYESFGRVVVEAMAFKRPVVASSVGGLPELIDHGRDGFLFDKGDFKELARIIKELFSSEDLRRSIAGRGYEKYSARFTSKVMAVNYHKLLSGLKVERRRGFFSWRKRSFTAGS